MHNISCEAAKWLHGGAIQIHMMLELNKWSSNEQNTFWPRVWKRKRENFSWIVKLWRSNVNEQVEILLIWANVCPGVGAPFKKNTHRSSLLMLPFKFLNDYLENYYQIPLGIFRHGIYNSHNNMYAPVWLMEMRSS